MKKIFIFRASIFDIDINVAAYTIGEIIGFINTTYKNNFTKIVFNEETDMLS